MGKNFFWKVKIINVVIVMSVRSTKASARNLYKQIIYTGRNYPGGLDYVRRMAKKEYKKYENETDPKKIKMALARGRWYLKELEATIQLHKYRTLKKNYYD